MMETAKSQVNKSVVTRYVDELQNGHDLEAIVDVSAKNFVDHAASSGGAFFGGLDGLYRGTPASWQLIQTFMPISNS